MRFIVGVTLLVVQLSSVIRALDPDQADEHSKIDSEKPTSSIKFIPLHINEQISNNEENSLIVTKTSTQADKLNYPVNYALKEPMTRVQRDVGRKLKMKLRSSGEEKPDGIDRDIVAQEVGKALEQVQNQKDLQGIMNHVIYEVYNSSVSNLDPILQFVDSNNNVTTNLAVFEALNHAMDVNKHNDHRIRLNLIKNFHNKSDQSSIPDDDQSKAKEVKTAIHNSVTNCVAEELMDALKRNDSKEISTICENVYNNYPALFKKAIRRALDDGFGAMNKRYLVDFFNSHKYQSQSVLVYYAMFLGLRKINRLDQTLLINLALALKKAMDTRLTDFNSRDAATDLKIMLPESVRNIAFARRVCIVNADYRKKEHLYGAVDEFRRNKKRRTLYTWSGYPTGRVSQGNWFLERREDRDTYFIKNERKKRRFEFMYAAYFFAGFFSPDESRRYTFTWIPGLPDTDQFDWVFIPKGDHVFIKNVLFDEWLYASDSDTKDDARRWVYTGKIEEKRMKGSLWTIVDCTSRLNSMYFL